MLFEIVLYKVLYVGGVYGLVVVFFIFVFICFDEVVV